MLTNPVAPFYEFYLTIVNGLPAPFIKFVALGFVCYFILAGLQLFWSSR